MRGTFGGFHICGYKPGIIPAGAGHFLLYRCSWCYLGDHPRRCGALVHLPSGRTSRIGSSPQVRGTWTTGQTPCRNGGIIPAGAGHFPEFYRLARSWWDHPRRCGALVLRTDRAPRRLGSSPQVRGTYPLHRYRDGRAGIIPAGAGHFSRRRRNRRTRRDHPRRCGALTSKAIKAAVKWGSSPQVRGTWRAQRQGREPGGIIPAGAGHLLPRSDFDSLTSDHPRRCGALEYPPERRQIRGGSSPQVRGTSGGVRS